MIGVIFDLDGVLVDSEEYWQLAFAKVVNRYTRESGFARKTFFRRRSMRRFEGGRVNQTVREILLDIGHPAADDTSVITTLTDQVIDIASRAFERNPQAIPSSVAVAKELASKGVPMAVASSSAEPFIITALTTLGLQDSFQELQSALHLAHGKPDPDVYRRAARKLGLSARDCVAIEDSEVGVLAATRAQMYCVGLWRREGDPPSYFDNCQRVRRNTLTSTAVDEVRTMAAVAAAARRLGYELADRSEAQARPSIPRADLVIEKNGRRIVVEVKSHFRRPSLDALARLARDQGFDRGLLIVSGIHRTPVAARSGRAEAISLGADVSIDAQISSALADRPAG